MYFDSQLTNTAMLLGIAAFTFGSAVMATISVYVNAHTNKVALATLEVAKITEKNTNSMKDALVLSTAKLSHAEGLAEGIAQEKNKSI